MFDKLKKLKELKELRDSLAQEKVEIEKEGVKVVLNGKMEIEEIKLNSGLDQVKQEEVLKECVNEAIKKMQMLVAQKMMQGNYGDF